MDTSDPSRCASGRVAIRIAGSCLLVVGMSLAGPAAAQSAASSID